MGIVDPFGLVRLVEGDDPDRVGVDKGYLYVQRAACLGVAQQQAARGVLVLGVILDEAGVLDGLEDFGIGDVALHGSLEGMTTEVELACLELMEDLLEGFHVGGIIPEWGGGLVTVERRPAILYMKNRVARVYANRGKSANVRVHLINEAKKKCLQN